MKKKLVAVLLVLLLVFAFTACQNGSSTATESQSASSQQPEVASDTPAAEVSESAAAESQATASVEGFQGPTEKATAPKGIKVAIVPNQASLSGCIVPGNAIQEIGKRYDWETQIFDGRGTPAEENAAILDAIAWGADVIATISLDARSVQQGIVAANEAGIPIVSGSSGADDPNPKLDLDEGQIDFAYDIGPDYYGLGQEMAEWMQKDSNDAGSVVIYSCPGVASVDLFEDGLLDGLGKTNLQVDPELQTFTFDQLGETLNRMVTGYVTSHDVDYVFIPFDPAALGPVEALGTAGLEDVKVCSVLGTTEMVELIRQGTVAACTAAYDSTYLGYAEVDQFIRILNDQELIVPHGENVPYAIVDSTNLPSEGSAWVPAFDYKSAYYALWD